MNGTAWAVIAIGVLFVLAAMLAIAETGFLRMNRVRAIALDEEGKKGAGRLARMLEAPERTINSVTLLALACQVITANLLGIIIGAKAGAGYVVLGIFLNVVVFFMFGEAAPKTWAVQHADEAALRTSGFLWFLTRFPPLRWMVRGLLGIVNIVLPGRGLRAGPFVTESEIRQMADVAAEEASIETEERELIHSIFEFGDTVVREVMRPRPDLIAVEVEATVEEAINASISAGFSRIPVYEETIDNIVGLIFLKDLAARAAAGDGSEQVSNCLRAAHFVPESKKVAELMREMQREKFHMAVVVDEYGGTAGVVTMEDLLEEIVGEITDEYDIEEPQLERLGDGLLRAPGRTPIDDVNDELDSDLPHEDWDTVGGLVFSTLGHVPAEGECLTFEGFEFCTERVQGRRIVSVLVKRLPDTNGDHAGPA